MGVNKILLYGFGAFYAFCSFFVTVNYLLYYHEFNREGVATILKKSLITVSDGQTLNLDFELVIDSINYNFNAIDSDMNISRYRIGQKVTVIYKFIDNGYGIDGMIKPDKSQVIIYYLVFLLSMLAILKCLHFFVYNWGPVMKVLKEMSFEKE